MSLILIEALCQRCGYKRGVDTNITGKELKKLVCPHCGRVGLVDNGLIRPYHSHPIVTGERSELGKHIDNQTPFGR